MPRFGLCHWIGQALGAVLILWFVCAVTGTLVLCVSRALPEKPLCYPRSCSTWQFNNSLYLLLNSVPQEAMLFDLHFWLFLFHPISLLFGFQLKSVNRLKNIFSSSELNLLQETFKMILSNKLSRYFPSLESIIHQAGLIIHLLILWD